LKFWDASAVVPLLVSEPQSAAMRSILLSDTGQTAWWATRSECVHALARSYRTGGITSYQEAQARVRLQFLSAVWQEVMPTYMLRALAEVMLGRHPLRTADAFQLASALAWCGGNTLGQEFVCLDNRLRGAATAEGFAVLP